MIRRYLPRTGSFRSGHSIQTELLNSLRQQGESLLKQLTQQFASDLQALQQQALQNSLGGNGDGVDAGSYTRLFGSAISYLVARPRIASNTTETARSADAATSFKLSQAQTASETSDAIARGDKNR